MARYAKVEALHMRARSELRSAMPISTSAGPDRRSRRRRASRPRAPRTAASPAHSG